MTKMILLWIATAILSFGLGWLASSHWPAQEAARPAKVAFGPAVRDALRETSPAIRTRRLANLFETMQADQIEEAAAIYARELDFIASFEIELLYEAWARHDPHAALAHGENLSKLSKRQSAVEATIRSWATREPLAARDAVTELLEEKPTLREASLGNLVVGWVASGQPGVVAYLLELSEPYTRLGRIALAGAQTRRLDAVELESWADDVLLEVEDAEFNEQLFRKVAKVLARRDPTRAIEWVDRHADADYAGRGIRLVVEFGLPADPEAILAWSSRVDPETRESGLRAGARRWVEGDFAGASSFIKATLLSPIHDPIVAEYAGALFRKSEWLRSIDWAQRISDEELRIGTLRRASMLWLRNDPSAAEAWLAQSPLDEAVRDKVREAAARPTAANRKRKPTRPRAQLGGG